MKLILIPYAGGDSKVYKEWSNYFDDDIKLYTVELKGRGNRFEEGIYNSVEETIEDIFHNIKDIIADDDYAIFGHSMGSILAYELYYKIVESGYKLPKHIFFSGNKHPKLFSETESVSDLDENELLKKVNNLGGISKEIFNNKMFRRLFYPIIRNDIILIGSYKYNKKIDKIKCNATILFGEDDVFSKYDMAEWNEYCSAAVNIKSFQGNHFFIKDKIEDVTKLINNTIKFENANKDLFAHL